jgi:CRISPR-associated protein Cas4
MVKDPLIILIMFGALWLFFLFLKGKTPKNVISNDDVLLTSERLGLIGRPDRIIEDQGIWIPIEKKSATKVQSSHRVQLCVYMILIEEKTGKRPPHGFIALRDNTEHKVKNTDKLRAKTWAHVETIRTIKQRPKDFVKASPFPAKCKSCGYIKSCKQAKS